MEIALCTPVWTAGIYHVVYSKRFARGETMSWRGVVKERVEEVQARLEVRSYVFRILFFVRERSGGLEGAK